MFFVVARGIFVIYFSAARGGLSFAEIMGVFEHGIFMDFSTAAYITTFTGLLLAVLYFRTGIQLWPIWIVVHTVLLIGASLVIVYDLASYPTWKYRLDVRALLDIGGHSVGGGPVDVLVLISIFIVLAASSFFLMFRIFWQRFYSLRATGLTTMPVILVLTALLIVPMRGSLGVVTMNASFAYSHPTHAFANHAGVNVVWNFVNSLRWPAETNDALAVPVAQAYSAATHMPDSAALVNGRQPNIIIILLDRFPADVVGALGGRADVTPHFNALAGEGILFDQFYSTSDRMDKGLAAVLSGYPSASPIPAAADLRRAQGLPYLNKIFKTQGYRTGFTCGGWPNYENLRAYLFSAGFDSITNANDFVADRRTGKWGVPDEFVFEKFSDEVFHDRQPFFRVMVTQSTRKPYDAPMDKVFKGQDEETQFMNAVHYTDQWLGNFIDQAKRTLWWQNTVIIITSDQGGTLAANAETPSAPQSRIPMLWLGGAVTQPGTVIHSQGNQTDICKTLLTQLGQHSDAFRFSRNILSEGGDQGARVDYAAAH
jgi:phosphoglycerol transferase MdoB-like AlkP superfamily enzyme